MLDELRRYIKNKKVIDGRARQILGSDSTLKEFALFWANHGSDLMMIAAVNLHDWEHEREFDKAELKAFREGLGVFGVFFSDCWMTVEKEKQELENKSKVDKK